MAITSSMAPACTCKKPSPGAVLQARTSGIIAVSLERATSWWVVSITPTARMTSCPRLVHDGREGDPFGLEDEVRPMGREAAGVRGVKLSDDHW